MEELRDAYPSPPIHVRLSMSAYPCPPIHVRSSTLSLSAPAKAKAPIWGGLPRYWGGLPRSATPLVCPMLVCPRGGGLPRLPAGTRKDTEAAETLLKR